MLLGAEPVGWNSPVRSPPCGRTNTSCWSTWPTRSCPAPTTSGCVTNSTSARRPGSRANPGQPTHPTACPTPPPGEARTFTVATPTPTGTRVEADIWFRCHGTTPATGYLADELAAARTPDCYFEVTPQLQVVGFDRVYALGDIAAIDTNKAGVAGRQAVVVVTNIRAQLDGTDERAAYPPGPPAIILRWDPPEARDSSPPRTTSPPPSSSRRSRGRTDDRPVHRAPQRPGGGGECQDNGCSLIDHWHAVT